MAEWTNARLLKSRETRVSVGSNPTPSAGRPQVQSVHTVPAAGRAPEIK